MQRLEVSCAVRHLYRLLGVKGLIHVQLMLANIMTKQCCSGQH